MTEISILVRAKHDAALNKTIKSIVQQNVKLCNIFIINYGLPQKSLDDVQNNLKDCGYLQIVNTQGCWASDLNMALADVVTPYCIICNEGTEWSPDYFRMSCVDLKTIQKKYNSIAAYVCRGTENYGYYVQNIFRNEETHHIQPALEEGFVNISDMIFKNQFSLDQAIFSTSFVKKGKFNPELGHYAYWDFFLQLIFQGNIYATNQQHAFLHYDYKEPSPPWAQNNILQQVDKNAETAFHNHIFRNGIMPESAFYNRVATERGFGHVYHLVHNVTEKMSCLNDTLIQHEKRIDCLDNELNSIKINSHTMSALLKKQEGVMEDIRGVSQSISYNAFLLKAGKVFDGLGKIKRKFLKGEH
ncbi:hypothetical protein ATR1_058c0001 [Acetobacter tropicalis]|uniref:Glycosyltransferase 2-like domain-containing protein n=2 Tax=Acetobacter tropicalis TaxID=104102 RepID=A0A511FL46_9PROT|nr:hypothetical protein [Acetobacter tropicalis]KXV45419.1 hypothetical protein AD944_15905 [Acetobacter tropicalis]GAL97030.1 hypothetical protein ATR1_058c0001 [Acetobacter tropicalis]GEL49137.1 hypothetical protein ATR01nite_02120 [Acetobacter tropicalis]